MEQVQTQQRVYSSFWVRFAAAIIDSFVVQMVFFGIQILFMLISFIVVLIVEASGVGADSAEQGISTIFSIVLSLVGLIGPFVYYIYMTYTFRATLGKMAVGIRVEQEDGAKLSVKRIAFREVIGKFISGVTLCIGYIMAAFTPRKQALHDIMSKTVVVYVDPVKKARTAVVAAVIAVYGVLTVVIIGVIALIMVIIFTQGGYDNAPGEYWQYDGQPQAGFDVL